MIDLKLSIVGINIQNGGGSGVLIEGGFILSALHNIKSSQPTKFYLFNEAKDMFCLAEIAPMLVKSFDHNNGDFVVYELQPEEKNIYKSRFLKLGSEKGKEGEKFECYGFPSKEEETSNGIQYSGGTINSIHHLFRGKWSLTMTCNNDYIGPGFSGSPIVTPYSKEVIGLILREKGGEKVIGVGADWISDRFYKEATKTNKRQNSLFDKKIPSLDYDLYTCNRDEQVHNLHSFLEYPSKHKHIFLLAARRDRPESLILRFLQELRGEERYSPDYPFFESHEVKSTHRYIELPEFPASEAKLSQALNCRLQDYNQSFKKNISVFFWSIPSTIVKDSNRFELLQNLLYSNLLLERFPKHQIIIFYWFDSYYLPNKKWFKNLSFSKKHYDIETILKIFHKMPDNSFRLIKEWEHINEKHLENWFSKYQQNIAEVDYIYRSWVAGNAKGLDMGTVEAKLKDLIVNHNNY